MDRHVPESVAGMDRNPHQTALRFYRSNPTNLPPTANAGAAQTVNEGSAVTLAGSGTDADGSIASYVWTQTAGLAVVLSGANTATATFATPQVTADAVLSFRLTVTDNNGGSGSATTSVTVLNVNQLPTANAGQAQTVSEGGLATLCGSGSDPDGTITSYQWTQTAGPAVSLANANTATASFTAPQVTADTLLSFQLTVTDNNGGMASATTSVTVRNVAPGPDLVVTAVSSSVTTIRRGRSFTFRSTTRNQGNRATTRSTNTGLYLSTDTSATTADTRVGSVSVDSGLAAGASRSVK